MARKQPKHVKLVEYLGQAYHKEREIESALAAQIVMATRPGYQKRLERHLEDTKVRTQKLQKRLGELGAPNGGAPGKGAAREAKAAAKTVTDRAATLAKAPAGAMRGDPEADKLLENARAQLAGAGEQIANYRIVRSLARAAGDKPTRRLARDFRREHEDLGEYVAKAIPTLSRAVAKKEAEAPRSSGGRRRSGASAKRSGGSASRSRASSARGKSGGAAPAGRSRSSSARGKSTASARRSRASSARGKSTAASGRSRSSSSSAKSAGATAGRRSSTARSGSRASRPRSASAARKSPTKARSS